MDDEEARYRATLLGGDKEEAAGAAINLVSSLADQGRLDEADAILLQAAVDRGDAAASLSGFRHLGTVLRSLGRIDDAERAFRHVIAVGDPHESGAAAVNLGSMQRDMGRPDEAEAAFRTAMRVGQADVAAVAAVNLANLLKARGDRPGEVEAAYRLAADSGDAVTRGIARSNLAQLLIEQGRRDEAEAVLRDAMSGGHQHVVSTAAEKLARLLLESGRQDDAIATLLQGLAALPRELDGDDVAAWRTTAVNLGVMLRDLDHAAEAEEAFRVGARLGDAGSMMELAKLVERRGDTAEAINLYRTLAESSKNPLLIRVGTDGLNRLRGTPGAPGPGVERVLADLDPVIAVLRSHGALFAYLDHQPRILSNETDRTVAAWFDPARPLPDPSVVASELGPVVDRIEQLNTAPLQTGYHIARTGRLILDDDPPARIAWLTDVRMVGLDQSLMLGGNRTRSHGVNFLSSPDVPPARLEDMIRFIRLHRQTVLDIGAELRGSPHLANDTALLTRWRNVFFAAVIGCKRTAHLVIADHDWDPPPSPMHVFTRLVERGMIGAPVATALSAAEDALDDMFPYATPVQVVQLCIDPVFTDAIAAFLEGVDSSATGRRRFRLRRR